MKERIQKLEGMVHEYITNHMPVKAHNDSVAMLQEEIDAYKAYFQKLWSIAMPSPKGYYRRGAMNEVLNLAADATSWYDRHRTYATTQALGKQETK